MSFIDVAIIVLYLAALPTIGLVVSLSVKINEDAVVAGKSFGVLSAAVGKTANQAGASQS